MTGTSAVHQVSPDAAPQVQDCSDDSQPPTGEDDRRIWFVNSVLGMTMKHGVQWIWLHFGDKLN